MLKSIRKGYTIMVTILCIYHKESVNLYDTIIIYSRHVDTIILFSHKKADT